MANGFVGRRDISDSANRHAKKRARFHEIELCTEGIRGERAALGHLKVRSEGLLNILDAANAFGNVKLVSYGGLGQMIESVGQLEVDRAKKRFIEFEVDGKLIEGLNADVEKVYAKPGAKITFILRTPEVYSNENMADTVYLHYDKMTGRTREIGPEELRKGRFACAGYKNELKRSDTMFDAYELYLNGKTVGVSGSRQSESVVIIEEREQARNLAETFLRDTAAAASLQKQDSQVIRRILTEGAEAVSSGRRLLGNPASGSRLEAESGNERALRWLAEAGFISSDSFWVRRRLFGKIAPEFLTYDSILRNHRLLMLVACGRKEELLRRGEKLDPLEEQRLKSLHETVSRMMADADLRLKLLTEELEKLQARKLQAAKNPIRAINCPLSPLFGNAKPPAAPQLQAINTTPIPNPSVWNTCAT